MMIIIEMISSVGYHSDIMCHVLMYSICDTNEAADNNQSCNIRCNMTLIQCCNKTKRNNDCSRCYVYNDFLCGICILCTWYYILLYVILCVYLVHPSTVRDEKGELVRPQGRIRMHGVNLFCFHIHWTNWIFWMVFPSPTIASAWLW